MSKSEHRISLADALRVVAQGRKARWLPVEGWTVGAEIIREILAQPGAQGLRCYVGATDKGDPTLVFLAVDGEGHDQHRGTIAEYAKPCPPICDLTSPFRDLQ